MKNNKFQFIEPKPKTISRDKLFAIYQDELIKFLNEFDIISISQVAENSKK